MVIKLLNDKWESVKVKINQFLFDYLTKFEWYYGDCRAPFRYPANFAEELDENKRFFSCEILLDFSDGSPFVFHSQNPDTILMKVKTEILARFGEPWNQPE